MGRMLPETFTLYILISGHLHGRGSGAASELLPCAWLLCTVSKMTFLTLWFSEILKANHTHDLLFSDQPKNTCD